MFNVSARLYIKLPLSQLPGLHIIQCDLSDWDKTRKEISQIDSIDLLVNNAGIAKIRPFTEVTKDEIDSYVLST